MSLASRALSKHSWSMQVLIVSLIFAKACGVLSKLINDKLKHRKACHIDDFNGQECIWLWLTENRTQGGLNKPGVYFPHLTQNLELRGPSPSSCPRVLKEPSDYPLPSPLSGFWPHFLDWLSVPEGASGVCAGEWRKHCFLFKILRKNLSPETSICISLVALCYMRFWDCNCFSSFSNRSRHGKKGRHNESNPVSPRWVKWGLWQKFEVVTEAEAYLYWQLTCIDNP